MTLQMDDNRKYQPHEWLLVQKTEYNKETKSRLMLTYGDFSKLMEQMDDGEVLPAKVREGVAVMAENQPLSLISKGWNSRPGWKNQKVDTTTESRIPFQAPAPERQNTPSTPTMRRAASGSQLALSDSCSTRQLRFLKTPSAPFGLGLQRSERPKEGRTPGNLDSPLGRTGLMMTEPQCLKFDGCSRTGSTGLIFG
eukprot:CAMPEP_0115119920 /NCGR_PEP_ID=MMETSP0227-20121206/45375_1 /TAXON_ID=89957 /ORGANISM="Polarella glacialis, Strain CCMP 1383" /LENGTH=195 /DNA_ID=CAMNT_0002521475 /DNA_START=83 /DNA_END=666 /DNA_ORIENTATION=-